jgi:hypothetical protein
MIEGWTGNKWEKVESRGCRIYGIWQRPTKSYEEMAGTCVK